MENTIIKNSVILDLDVYTKMQKELEDLREAKYCLLSIGNFGDYYNNFIYLPNTKIDSKEVLKHTVQSVLDNHFNRYDKIIEENNKLKEELDKVSSDTYIDGLRKTVIDQRYKIEKFEKELVYFDKLKDELKYYRGKKK